MRNMNLRLKLLACGIILSAVPLLALSGISLWQNDRIVQTSTAESNRLAHDDLGHIADLLYRTVASAQEGTQMLLKTSLNLTRELVASHNGASLSEEKVAWDAVNQYSKVSARLELPKMMVGDKWLGQERQMQASVPIVDQVKQLVGCTSTVFQMMNPAGDMLRVATNVAKEDGTRAIGTYIPAVNPDGKPNPVIASILKGEAYIGRAVVVNAWYLTAYEPLYDKNRKIIGMLYVGIPHEEIIKGLKETISGIKVGKSGYVFVLDSKGDYIISQGGKRNGENIWDTRDADGKPLIQEMIKKAVTLKPNETASHEYSWKNAGESAARQKITRLVYFQPWDWVIGPGAYKDEFMEGTLAVQAIGNRSFTIMLCVIGIAMVLTAVAWLFISRSIVNPITRIIHALGDNATSVSAASAQLASAGQLIAEGASEQASSIEEISSSLEEMASMTRQNADNARQADVLMGEGNENIKDASHSMTELMTSMGEISTASEETSKIVKTIDEIAFQTNLLALNAAVEAARAGEAGAGFAVVADEVRNLALRAAEAAQNTSFLIEGTVKKIRDGSDQVIKTNDAFDKVAKTSMKVTGLIAEIASASKEQAMGIEQVNTAVSQMDKIVQQNASQAEESASSAEGMDAQASEMQNVVGQLGRIISGSGARKARAAVAQARPARRDSAPAAEQPARKAGIGAPVRHKAPAHGNGKDANGALNGQGHPSVLKQRASLEQSSLS